MLMSIQVSQYVSEQLQCKNGQIYKYVFQARLCPTVHPL